MKATKAAASQERLFLRSHTSFVLKKSGLFEDAEKFEVVEREDMSISILHRLTPYFSSRIRYNQRLLSSYSLLHEAESPSPSVEDIHMTEDCIRRIKELKASEAAAEGKLLRLSVETGGCSGFQYIFLLDDKANPDDRIFEKEGVKLVVDNISYDFVKGATVDFVEELIRSAFVVTENPSAVGGCSCKSSFMVKQ